MATIDTLYIAVRLIIPVDEDLNFKLLIVKLIPTERWKNAY